MYLYIVWPSCWSVEDPDWSIRKYCGLTMKLHTGKPRHPLAESWARSGCYIVMLAYSTGRSGGERNKQIETLHSCSNIESECRIHVTVALAVTSYTALTVE